MDTLETPDAFLDDSEDSPDLADMPEAMTAALKKRLADTAGVKLG